MKKTGLLFTIVFATLAVVQFSCSKGGGGGTPTPSGGLTITTSKNTVRADNFDAISITVKDQNNVDVTSTASIRVNGTIYNGNVFYATTAGSYSIKAVKGSLESAPVTVTASDPGPSPYTQKLLVEDFTGTWCGYCPRVGESLKTYSNSNPNSVVIGVHGPAGSSDPYTYQYVTQLTSLFSVTGWPTAIVNRNYKWSEANTQLNAELAKRAPLGIGLETSVSGSTIAVKAKVKFDVTTDMPMKLVVMLVEDGLVYAQTNYYAPTYGGNPISGYVHNKTLRTAGTDIFGDDIPAASQTAGTTWEKTMNISATGYNISNCKIVATVVYGTNGIGRKGSLNTQIVAAGQNKNFD